MRKHRAPKQLLIEAQAEIDEFRINAAEEGDTTLTRGQCADLADLLEALAEHVEHDAEPVAWRARRDEMGMWRFFYIEDDIAELWEREPLYATAGAAKAAATKEHDAND